MEKWQAYREEDKHECDLLSTRINALLTSQTFMLATAAVVYSVKLEGRKALLMLLAFAGFLTVVLTGVAICQGCRVVRAWHKFSEDLLRDPELKSKVEGCYLHCRRPMPDGVHIWSIEVFGAGLSILFGVLWLVLIVLIFML